MAPPEMVPAEEAVEVLLDSLVAPFLPRRANSMESPTLEQQESVAKQMYAVVVLYNYYHRKLFPKLEFLDFKSFCQIVCISKPLLLKYMKAMFKGYKSSGDLDELLSITERMIMDACNVSSALDASKVAPDMEDWPISKVAVFLVDYSKEYCLLSSNNVSSQAIMSIVEKDLEAPLENVACLSKTKNKSERVTNASIYLQEKFISTEDILQKVAFSTVEKEMGINCSNLSILGCHLSYSLSRVKSSSCLYIMSYSKPIENKISVKEVMQSLQGPLVKINNGSPEVTAVIRYYNLLPYADIISDCLCKETSYGVLQNNLRLKADADKEKSERNLVIDNNNNNNNNNNKAGDDSDWSCKKRNNCSIMTGTINETICKKDEKPPLEDLFPRSQNAAISSFIKEVLLPTGNGEAKEDDVPALEQNLDIVISKKRKVKKKLVGSPRAAHCNYVDDSSAEHNPKKLVKIRETNLVNAISHNSADNVENRFNQIGEHMSDVIVKLSSHNPLALAKKVDMMSVLQMLKKKREELCQQQRLLEDNMSHCEMNILTLLSGNEISASRIEPLLKTYEFLCSNEMKKDTNLSTVAQCHTKTISRKRLCEAVLCLQNQCQELDEIFCTNNWILPKYWVLPSTDGKFQALVSVRGMDFECDCTGDWKSSPLEARESAATHMLSKLRGMASEAQ